jgi:hypothetical protein
MIGFNPLKGLLWLFVLSGATLLAVTWFLNAGINGSDLIVSMVALVAMTAVLKPGKRIYIVYAFIPLIRFLVHCESVSRQDCLAAIPSRYPPGTDLTWVPGSWFCQDLWSNAPRIPARPRAPL